jgi:TonB family protein
MDEKSQFSEQMPRSIGRYQVHDCIGFGAMGAVYKAFDPLIKRTLAIKTIRLDIPRQSPQYKSFIDRFYHEARISGTLSHPNIVTLFDIGEEGGVPYLAMEFVEGETIAGILEKGTKFDPEKVIGLVSQIAAAIDYAHSRGVIHRDIKPSNLMLFERDRVKVTDFGIAKLVDAEMTQSGTLLGTPSYMSPEQAMGEKLDHRSDIFSLGVCAFEMLSGEQPFPGTNVTSILYKLVHVDPIEPANLEMNGLVPQKWHDVFSRVLAKQPDDRYQTATEFVQDLEFCLGAWFGSAVGDDTLSDLSAATPGAPATARGAPPNAPAPAAADEVTRLIAVPPAVAQAASPSAPEPDEVAPTVVMRAPVQEAVGETVVMRAEAKVPPPTPPAETKAKPKAKVATPAPKVTSAPKPVSPAEEATVVFGASPKGLPDAATKPPAGSTPAEEPTILMTAPVVPSARVRVPPTARSSAGAASLRPEDETVRAAPLKPAAPSPSDATRRVPAGTPPPLPPLKPAAAATEIAPSPALAAPPAGKKRSSLLVIGGSAVAIVFVVTLAVGYVVARHLSSPQAGPSSPPPSPAPLPQEPSPSPAFEGVLRVDTEPPGAKVTVNGEDKGVSPVELAALPAGQYEVKVDLKGFEARQQTAPLDPTTPRAELSFTLQRILPTTGTVDILSTPFGAAVKVDGAGAGVTPVTGQRLKPGEHKVELSRDGYHTFATTVTIEAGKKAKVDAQLVSVPKATPAPTPPPAETFDPNKIYQNTAAEVDTLAKKISGLSPTYPDKAPRLKSGESVSVGVDFVVTENGEVTDIRVVESAGKIIDDAVVQAIQKAKWSPAVKKGVKVKVRQALRQTFRAG